MIVFWSGFTPGPYGSSLPIEDLEMPETAVVTVTVCTPLLAAESEIAETGEDDGVAVTVTVIASGCRSEDNAGNSPLWPAA